MQEIAVSPPFLAAASLALRRAALAMSAQCLTGQPAACGDDLASAAVAGLLGDVTRLTDAVATDLERVALTAGVAARAYREVDSSVARRSP